VVEALSPDDGFDSVLVPVKREQLVETLRGLVSGLPYADAVAPRIDEDKLYG